MPIMQILFEIISNHNSNTSNAGDNDFAGWMKAHQSLTCDVFYGTIWSDQKQLNVTKQISSKHTK